MIVEFELQGSKILHKGVFDTQGFWVKYEEDAELVLIHDHSDLTIPVGNRPILESVREVSGYKLYSHFSFSFYHTDKEIVDQVYSRLISILRGTNSVEIDGVGFIRKLNK